MVDGVVEVEAALLVEDAVVGDLRGICKPQAPADGTGDPVVAEAIVRTQPP